MLKLSNCPIEASNIANLGSELETQIKQNAAKCEHAWDGAGKQGGVLKIWRIEKFQVVAWPESELGKFYDGDSYIVLHTYKKKNSDALGHDVHFWLGSHTSQDEAGTAAYKTVELDDRLGGAPVQHREVEGHESDLFLSYFPNRTIELLQGGIESGFNHVEPRKYQSRLLQVKGTRKAVRVSQVPLEAKSLNAGDVFILDMGLEIIQWNGSSSSLSEKMKAGQVVRALKDERQGKPECLMVSQDESGGDVEKFWAVLGGRADVSPASQGGSDDEAAAAAQAEKKLYRLSDASGKLTFTLEKSGDISKNDLKSEDVFIVDVGAEIFVWIGSKSSKAERRDGLCFAQQYITDNGRPRYLPISRVVEGGENEVFNSLLGVRSRGFGEEDEGFPHSCCPHHPGSDKWSFTKNQDTAKAASTLFGAIGAGGGSGGAKMEQKDDVQEAVTQVFGFFSKSVGRHFF